MSGNYGSEWIHEHESMEHFISYWEQASLVMSELSRGSKLLEIGKGSGFLQSYLRLKGYSVTTIDIDKDKKPDIVADITEFSFDNVREFDCVLCFETFEHIDYQHFVGVLERLKGAGTETIIMSMPYHDLPILRLDARLAYWRGCFNARIPKLIARYVRKLGSHHKWEINYLNFSLNKIRSDISKTGYRITKEKDSAYANHHFFVLESL